MEFLNKYDEHNLKIVTYTQLKEHTGLDVVGRGQFKLAENAEFTVLDRSDIYPGSGWDGIRRLELYGSGTVHLGEYDYNSIGAQSRYFLFTVPCKESFLSSARVVDTIRCTLERSTDLYESTHVSFGIFGVCNIFSEIVILGDINLYIHWYNEDTGPDRIHLKHPNARLYIKEETGYFAEIKK
jgi:hypothetical protein